MTQEVILYDSKVDWLLKGDIKVFYWSSEMIHLELSWHLLPLQFKIVLEGCENSIFEWTAL